MGLSSLSLSRKFIEGRIEESLNFVMQRTINVDKIWNGK